ncbi:hypothetical protein WT22_18300 [Burkholderia territorii]|nr:hypothetical protein WT22_18300 [Burkholderia territorii]KWA30924.1 hypothetical protein WT40_21870 [Burkholderia territorii]
MDRLLLAGVVSAATIRSIERSIFVVVACNSAICVFLTGAEIVVELHFDDRSNVRLYWRL